jgi:ElaB/YqjD/DUF883 family membrane-anchored ribosome-binding protein
MEYGDVQQQMGELREDLLKLRSDLGGVLQSVMDATKAEAGEARERMEAKAREQLDQFAAAVSGARDQGRVMADRLCGQIETHPVGSVLGALGVGLLLGMLMSRK